MSYPMSAAIVGIALAAFILLLLRRDHLYLRDAMFWLCAAVIAIAFAIVPQLVDWLGAVAGVAYPPALILALVCCVLILKALLADMALTELRREVRRLNQSIALVDAQSQADAER